MSDTGNRPDTVFTSRDDIARPRRLRHSPSLRAAVRETRISAADFVYPLFIVHGEGIRRPIPSMPGICQLSVDEAIFDARKAVAAGIPAILLFGIPATKDPIGLENFAADGIIQQAISSIKEACPDLVVITDVCVCEYTDHGHCGLLSHGHPHLPDGYVLNDESVDILARVSLSHALAGADIVAPSAMLDGMVAGIRKALDAGSFHHLPIMSYAVKYASAFYGPFRDAAQGAPKFGDRRSHQMDPANAREALKEAAIDIEEGADFLMVKPALAYLDIIARLRDRFPEMPMVAYNTSGEYAMVKAAGERGWLDERATVLEKLIGIKRAGADLIISYHALEAAAWLEGKTGLSP